jgi:site-specific recombinase XerD
VTQRAVAVTTAGELVGVSGSFLEAALAFAREARRENTRRAYRAAYRSFGAFATVRLGRRAVDAADVDRDLVVAYRDHLAASGAAPSTISARLSALRGLAGGARPADRARENGRGQAHGARLGEDEYDTLLRVPDGRTRAGKCDCALLHVLSDGGLRRSEAVRLDVDDVVEARRARDPRRRHAVAGRPAQETAFELVVRDEKGGTSRTVPLTRRAHEALHTWWAARPASSDSTFFVSLESNRAPHALSPAAVAGIVAKHAERARLRDGLRAPHVLRHTFCTLLAERGVSIDVIRDLAGHASIRTTQKYIHVTDQRRVQAIARLETRRHPLDQPLENVA